MNQEHNLSNQQQEELIKKFREEIKVYIPNWAAIIEANKPKGNYTPKEMQKIIVAPFCKAIKSIRLKMDLTQQQMGERLSYSRQNISKIEQMQCDSIPIDKLDLISECFSVSVAYLLGLIDDDSIEPDITEYYFWEHPDSEYLIIKDRVIGKRLMYAIETFGAPRESLIKRLTENLNSKLDNQYDLIIALNTILETTDARKKSRVLSIIKDLSKIL